MSIYAIMEGMKSYILPSLLAADAGKLAGEIKRAEDAGADALHLDIMDGAFVPNLSFGPHIVAMAKKVTSMPLNVHLMLHRPDLFIKPFADAGADTIQIQVESSSLVSETLGKIRALGVAPAIVLNPETSYESALPYLSLVDECLQMTVYPGYGGQKFKSGPLANVRALRAAANAAGKSDFRIMVDGGIDRNSIAACAEAGANAFVAGTALYSKADMKAEINYFRALISGIQK